MAAAASSCPGLAYGGQGLLTQSWPPAQHPAQEEQGEIAEQAAPQAVQQGHHLAGKHRAQKDPGEEDEQGVRGPRTNMA